MESLFTQFPYEYTFALSPRSNKKFLYCRTKQTLHMRTPLHGTPTSSNVGRVQQPADFIWMGTVGTAGGESREELGIYRR